MSLTKLTTVTIRCDISLCLNSETYPSKTTEEIKKGWILNNDSYGDTCPSCSLIINKNSNESEEEILRLLKLPRV